MNARLIVLAFAVLSFSSFAETELPSVKQVQSSLRVADGLAVELVACEPQISSPVAMAFDENGVLYVVEMLDYPIAAKDKPPLGRIKRLEDRDGDGFYETATIFADNLLMANSVMPWRGGLIVTAAPQLLFLKDEDGDGVSESREIWFEGFTQGNPQLRASHPILGLDNFIYVTNGAKGGSIQRGGKKDSPVIQLGSQDFRFDARDPAGGVYEAISGYGQFGHAFDDWGQRFVCTNRNHWVHLPMESRYFAHNPNLAAPPPVRDDQKPGGAATVYPLSKNKTLAATHAGSFTSACGVYVYRGTALPEKFRGAIFTCEPAGNLVHAEQLEPDGATFRGKPLFDKAEFLASAETAFRPVNIAGGPDGALYVIDMCRADVEHPDWVPQHLRHRYDFDGPKDHGRIWRIVSKDKPPRREKPALGKAPVEELVKTLERPDDWWRTTAQRLLLERKDTAAITLLKKLAAESNLPQGRVHALALLSAFGPLDPEVLQPRIEDAHPRVREWAVKMSEPLLTQGTMLADIAKHASDQDARVRFQVALSLGAAPEKDVIWPLREIACRNGNDRWARMAVASAVPTQPEKLLLSLVGHQVWSEMLRELALLVGARKDMAQIGETIVALDKQWSQSVVLLGLADGLARRGERLEKQMSSLPEKAQSVAKACAAQARNALADRNRSADTRATAARLLVFDDPAAAPTALAAVLNRDEPEALQSAALSTLEAFPSEQTAELILAKFKTLLPSSRSAALRVLTSQPPLAAALLDALEKKKVQRGELDADSIRRLKASSDAAVKQRAAELLKDKSSEERQAIMKRYREALETPADPKNGRAHFQQHCAICHRIGEIGTAVGPNISDTFGREPEALLVDILDPNAAIDTNYTAYMVKTKQGAVLTGIIAAQNASSITLRGPGGKDETILTQDTAEIRSTGQSLMPEGLDQALTPEMVRDVIAYVRNWRDVEGK